MTLQNTQPQVVSSYLLSAERGYLLLPQSVREELNLTQRVLGLRADDACLSTPWASSATMGWALDKVVGFDTVVVHSAAAAGKRGYLARAPLGCRLQKRPVWAHPSRQ